MMAGRVGKRVYRSAEWRAVRLRVFERDGWKCTVCGRRGRLECDHRRPIAKRGDWFDLANLRTVCRGCHIKLTAQSNRRELVTKRAELRSLALGVE